jgi:hypothetical protein
MRYCAPHNLKYVPRGIIIGPRPDNDQEDTETTAEVKLPAQIWPDNDQEDTSEEVPKVQHEDSEPEIGSDLSEKNTRFKQKTKDLPQESTVELPAPIKPDNDQEDTETNAEEVQKVQLMDSEPDTEIWSASNHSDMSEKNGLFEQRPQDVPEESVVEAPNQINLVQVYRSSSTDDDAAEGSSKMPGKKRWCKRYREQHRFVRFWEPSSTPSSSSSTPSPMPTRVAENPSPRMFLSPPNSDKWYYVNKILGRDEPVDFSMKSSTTYQTELPMPKRRKAGPDMLTPPRSDEEGQNKVLKKTDQDWVHMVYFHSNKFDGEECLSYHSCDCIINQKEP